MKHTLRATLAIAACGLFFAGASPVHAAGCLKGAAVGGLAGHMAGHGVLGAAGGCAVGHHMANKSANNAERSQYQHQSTPEYNQNR